MAYSKQTFTFGQVLTSAQVNQLETNIADHVHGRSSVAKTGVSWPVTDKASGVTATATDIGEMFNCTAALTVAFDAAATLGAGWAIVVSANGGNITLDPNGAETIDGQSTKTVVNGAAVIVFSDGANLQTIGLFNSSFTSSQQTITSGGGLTIAHGLGTVPSLIMYYLVCQTGEHGYTASDVLWMAFVSGSASGHPAVSLVPDSTNLNVRFTSSATAFVGTHFTSGANVALTNGNWKIVFLAWV